MINLPLPVRNSPGIRSFCLQFSPKLSARSSAFGFVSGNRAAVSINIASHRIAFTIAIAQVFHHHLLNP